MSPYGFPHPGGVNEHVRHTYEELRSLGHDAWILTPKYGKERDSEGHVIRLGTGWAVPSNGSVGRLTVGWRMRPRIRDVLAAHRFDILHYHEPFVPFLGPAVLAESDTVNIGTFHAFGGFSPSYWVGGRAGQRLADRLHGRIAVSGAARHFISRYFPGDYRIIPNGVELDLFAGAQPFEELRDGTFNILFVGRLEDRKGLTYLLRGYHRMRKRHVDARLIVVGEGPKLREYRRYVATRRIRDVEFVGHVPLEDKLRYFASADVFCAPSTGQESFGIVLLEAMAAGLPDRGQRHPRLQERRLARRGRLPGRAAQPAGHRRRPVQAGRRPGAAQPDGRGGASQGSGVHLGERHPAAGLVLPRGPRARPGRGSRPPLSAAPALV